jgi:hypothetical protein
MSIPEEILDAQVAAGRLAPLLPQSPRAAIRRAMFVSADIWGLLEGRTDDEISEERYGRLRADLEAFVTAADLYPNYLFWLTPRRDVVWEIRSVEDIPSLRVLGRFAAPDVFVALSIEERAELAGWNSPQWKRAIRTCIQRWNTVFSPYPALEGGDAGDFFSGAIPDRYFKK